MPFATDTWGMVYNTGSWRRPASRRCPETWDELLEASRKAKEVGKIGFGFAAGTSAANTIWFLANFNWWSDGGSLVVDDGSRRLQGRHLGRAGRERHRLLQDLSRRGADHARQPRPGHLERSDRSSSRWLAGDMLAHLVPVFTAVRHLRPLARAQSRPGAAVRDGDDAARLGQADDPSRRPVALRERQHRVSRRVLEADAVAQLLGVLRDSYNTATTRRSSRCWRSSRSRPR